MRRNFFAYHVDRRPEVADRAHGIATALGAWLAIRPEIKVFNRYQDRGVMNKVIGQLYAKKVGLKTLPTVITNDFAFMYHYRNKGPAVA